MQYAIDFDAIEEAIEDITYGVESDRDALREAVRSAKRADKKARRRAGDEHWAEEATAAAGDLQSEVMAIEANLEGLRVEGDDIDTALALADEQGTQTPKPVSSAVKACRRAVKRLAAELAAADQLVTDIEDAASVLYEYPTA